MWKVLQFSIMSVVVIANSVWHWTPNGLAAGVVGSALAYFVTLLIVVAKDRFTIRRLKTDTPPPARYNRKRAAQLPEAWLRLSGEGPRHVPSSPTF